MHYETAIVTGASSGIGAALCRQLAAAGTRVGAVARRADLLSQLAADVRAAGGVIETAAADVGDRPSLLAAVASLAEKLGPPDLMLANAGVSLPSTADPRHAPNVEAMTRVNFLGVVTSFEAVLPAILARKRGHLVAVSSMASYKGLPGAAGYCATKAAVRVYCEALRIELAPAGVAVTCVCPGFIATPMTADNPYPMPLLMSADAGADRILRGLRRRPGVLDFPRRMKLLMKLSQWAPDWVIRRQATKVATQSD